MKRLAALFCALCLLAGVFAGCSAPERGADELSPAADAAPAGTEQAGELIVFAAASLTETLTEMGELFMARNPGASIVFNFDSSGTLKTQIQEGAECDVFISAGQKQMNQLDITASAEGNTEGLDFIQADTRFDILENKVALVVPAGNPAGIESYADLFARLSTGEGMLAMGNADVPVGQYTQKIFAYYGLEEEKLAAAGVISYGSNVKEIVTQVAEAAVDAGIVYQTDAFSAGLAVVDTATEEMCGQVIYPAAALKESRNPALAKAFLDFCAGPEAAAIFAAVGFTPMT